MLSEWPKKWHWALEAKADIWGLPFGINHWVKLLKLSIPMFCLPPSFHSVESSPDSSWPHVSEEGIAWGCELPTAPNSTEILHTINSTLFFPLLRGLLVQQSQGESLIFQTDLPPPHQGREMKTKGTVFFGKQDFKRFSWISCFTWILHSSREL